MFGSVGLASSPRTNARRHCSAWLQARRRRKSPGCSTSARPPSAGWRPSALSCPPRPACEAEAGPAYHLSRSRHCSELSCWGASIGARPTAAPVFRIVFSNVGCTANPSKVFPVRFLPVVSQVRAGGHAPAAERPPAPHHPRGTLAQGPPIARILLSTGQLPRTKKPYRYYDYYPNARSQRSFSTRLGGFNAAMRLRRILIKRALAECPLLGLSVRGR